MHHSPGEVHHSPLRGNHSRREGNDVDPEGNDAPRGGNDARREGNVSRLEGNDARREGNVSPRERSDAGRDRNDANRGGRDAICGGDVSRETRNVSSRGTEGAEPGGKSRAGSVDDRRVSYVVGDWAVASPGNDAPGPARRRDATPPGAACAVCGGCVSWRAQMGAAHISAQRRSRLW